MARKQTPASTQPRYTVEPRGEGADRIWHVLDRRVAGDDKSIYSHPVERFARAYVHAIRHANRLKAGDFC
jgi:hypothetical protein